MPSSPCTDREQIMEEGSFQRLETVGDYKHGSIKRVKLLRFLTYNAVEFTPGPRLNMVVGPNGTGKSSILCAICLGLGGEPRLLGRADQVESFIQNGETEAVIELEVANENGDDVIITRTIEMSDDTESGKRNGNKSSTFTWNGEIVSGKKVREWAANDFQIQLDNLCTFLPQEKVGNFSGINSKDLLLETEKTLSKNKHLYNTHLQLIEMEKELSGGDDEVDTLKERVGRLEDDIKRYKVGVDRLEERKKAEKLADLLRKKILWLKLDKAREDFVELRNEKGEAKKRLDELEEKLDPLVRAKEEANAGLIALTDQARALDEQVNMCEKNMDKQKQKYDRYDDQIEETLAELTTIDNTRAKHESDVQVLREKVQTLEEVLSQQAPLEQLEEEFAQARRDHESIRPEYLKVKTNLQELQRQMATETDTLSVSKRKLDKLQNENEQRRNHVLRQFDNVKKAYHWIQSNRNSFRKDIVGPIACEISPKSHNSAAFLEKSVGNIVLRSFVVQEKSDYDLLYQKVRVEQNVPINIILVDSINQQEPRLYSERKMTMLKKEHGVIGYLDESFDGPEIVMQALRTNCAVHKVLVGDARTQESLDNRGLGAILSESERDPNKLQAYSIFASKGTQSFRYQSSISKYSGKPSIRVDEVTPAKILTRGASDEAKQRVMQEIQVVQDRIDTLRPGIEENTRQEETILRKVQGAQQLVKDLSAKRKMIRKTNDKRTNYNRKLKEAIERLETNDEDEKRKLVEQLKQRVAVSVMATKAYTQSQKQLEEAKKKSVGSKLDIESSKARAKLAEEKAAEVEIAVEAALDAFRALKQKLSQEKRKYKEAMEYANRVAPIEAENGEKTALFETLMVELAQFDSVDLAQTALEEAELKVKEIHSDPNIVRLYEEKTKELETIRVELDDRIYRKEEAQERLAKSKEPWLNLLRETISTVDKRFTQYMSELGCIGGVALKCSEQGEDISLEDYGVEIKVSFRDGVKPTVLSSRVQSGGERSVSTIMYLMAMQDMMVSPFRCVDEINQGLDDRNERLVFKRIVENSTKAPGPDGPTDHCGQYWLITPKLLPNLIDMEVEAMNVVCIFNGPYNLRNPTDWCVDELVQLKRRRDTLGTPDTANRTKQMKTGE